MRHLSMRAALAACSLCATLALPAAASAAPRDAAGATGHHRHRTIVQRLHRVDHLLDDAVAHPEKADRDLDRARAALRRIDAALDKRSGGEHDPRIDAARAATREAEAAIDAHHPEEAREALRRAEQLVDGAIRVRTREGPTPTPAATPAAG